MGIDNRILKSIAQLGWKEPTLIQEKGIPLAIHQRKDILARGRTGCGKTGAYLVPILHLILSKKTNSSQQKTSAIILAPSKELSQQIAKHAHELNQFTSNHISILDIGSMIGASTNDIKLLMNEKPDIVVSTPAKLVVAVKADCIPDLKETIKFLVLDEADLMFSFGYEEDIQKLLSSIIPPHGCQSFIMSATLNTDVSHLKKLCLKNPVTLKLEESDLPDSSQLTQYHIQCEEQDKFVLINALFKLKLIRGRTIIFANDVSKCYKVKLFLDAFGVRSCILNPELPITSRIHVVQKFNEGVYDTIIASDEKSTKDASNRTRKQIGENSSKSQKEKDEEYGASRGIDFQFVSNVINFDFPATVSQYVHRVGRTGRGDREGTALSFVKIADNKNFEKVKEALKCAIGESVGSVFKPYHFRMEELDAIKYRSMDVLGKLNKNRVREARLEEIKRQLLNSEKLETFFKEHPKDLKVLRSDRELLTHQVPQSHLKHMPDYIIPPSLKAVVHGSSDQDFRLSVVPHTQKRKRSGNPLKTFSFKKGKK
jgi:ATP-dependent RNA helicase DDX56/DBP9